jgi:hypothetical protein
MAKQSRPMSIEQWKGDLRQAGLKQLAKQINDGHKAIVAGVRKTLESAMAIGDLLNKAKVLAGHGNYTAWVEKHCRFSQRTAQLYTRVAANRETIAAKMKSRSLGLVEAVELLVPPKAEFEMEGPSLYDIFFTTEAQNKRADAPTLTTATTLTLRDTAPNPQPIAPLPAQPATDSEPEKRPPPRSEPEDRPSQNLMPQLDYQEVRLKKAIAAVEHFREEFWANMSEDNRKRVDALRDGLERQLKRRALKVVN